MTRLKRLRVAASPEAHKGAAVDPRGAQFINPTLIPLDRRLFHHKGHEQSIWDFSISDLGFKTSSRSY